MVYKTYIYAIDHFCEILEFPLRRTKSELPWKRKGGRGGSEAKRQRLPSSSERERHDRNDSIVEEDDGIDDNPFVGDRELIGDDDDDDVLERSVSSQHSGDGQVATSSSLFDYYY